MALKEAFPGVSGVVDSLEARRVLSGLVFRDRVTGLPRAGVLPRNLSGFVGSTSSTGPMTVSVGPFEAVLVRESGILLTQNDGSVSVSIATAPVSNSRIDVIYAKQNESASPMSDGSDTPVIGVVTGTASASPVKPSVPVGALELGAVEIPSGVTATNQGGVVITQTCNFTTSTLGVLWVRTTAELADLGAPRGQLAYVVPTATMWMFDGSDWRLVSQAPAYGKAYNPSPQDVPTTAVKVVTFPTPTMIGDIDFGFSSRFVIEVAGVYQVTAGARFQANGTSYRLMEIRVNAATTSPPIRFANSGVSGVETAATITGTLSLSVGDHVTLVVQHEVAATLELREPFLSLERINL